VFTVTGAQPGATCTASEPVVPAGYTRNQTDCQNGDPLNGSCTIVNTLNTTSGSFTVNTDFSDNSTTLVNIHLVCSSGTVSNTPLLAREGQPAVFSITGAQPGATCTATEPVPPSGYTADDSDCQSGDPLNGSCTIVNTSNSNSGTFTVFKDFSDNSAANVSITASCSSGTVTNSPQSAREGQPAVFTVTGALPGATCTATEPTVPAGYSRNQTDCQNGDPLNGSCTIVNTLNPPPPEGDTFTVYKDFSDDSTATVSVSLNCTRATVTNSPQSAAEGAPAIFYVTGAKPNTRCTATENVVPPGYSADQSDCSVARKVNSSCTLVNNRVSSTASFTVYKDFSDNSAASVSISLSCSSGTVTNSPRLASEGAPAVFSISGAAPGTTCSAVESPVPDGYIRNQSDCQDGDAINGSCTIVNTDNGRISGDTIFGAGFEQGDAAGWELNGTVNVDSSVAIDQYALRHEGNGAASERGISTVGYENVSVSMQVAAQSLGRHDTCNAEVSLNGGNSWLSVVQVEDGSDAGNFYSGILAPAGADDNPNLRLRFSLSTKGRGDGVRCWGDEVLVTGTPLGAAFSSDGSNLVQSQVIYSQSNEFPSTLSGSASSIAGRSGFDPGYDNLFGDGVVDRTMLTFDELVTGGALEGAVAWSSFEVPPGAATPNLAFEGNLSLFGAGLPRLDVDLIQIRNHVYPVARASAATDSAWEYIVGTGRTWMESGDRGYARVSLPFALLNVETGCLRDGASMFLFRDDGATSRAIYRVSDSTCDTDLKGTSGLLAARYEPQTVDSSELAIEAVMDCAAELWLPLVQGRGGAGLVLLPDDSLVYELSLGQEADWLDARSEALAFSSLCD